MTPEQERDLLARVDRLELFVDRAMGLLDAAGKVLDSGHIVARSLHRRAWTGQEPEKERDREHT